MKTDDQVIEAVKSSLTYAAALTKLGLVPAGGNYATLKQRIQELDIDTSHMCRQSWLKGKRNPHKKPLPLDVVLVNNRPTNSNRLRKRLVKEGLLEDRCESCGNTEWENQAIPLELDHINGVKADNRIENLRVLCPNCHALTPTYRGKNIKPRPGTPAVERVGLNPIKGGFESHAGHKTKTKIDWPDTKTLQSMVDSSNYCQVAKQLGVSDNAVRKRIRNHPEGD